MSWFSKLFSGGIASLIKEGGDLVDKFVETPEERQKFKLQLEEVITQRLQQTEESARTELKAKQALLTAELKQGDTYTKRARPTVVYMGLLMIAFNYCVVPLTGAVPVVFPTEFWAAWGGIVGSWVVGRSYEKRGNSSKLSRTITGSKESLLD